MERDQRSGRFVRKGAAPNLEVEAGEAAARPRRISKGWSAAHRAFVQAFPEIVEALIEKAASGSVAHVKLLIEIDKELLSPNGGKDKGKSLEAILMEQWRKDAAMYGPR